VNCEGYTKTTIFVHQTSAEYMPGQHVIEEAQQIQDPSSADPTTWGPPQPLHDSLARGALVDRFLSDWWASYLPSTSVPGWQAPASLSDGQELWSIAFVDSVYRMSASSPLVSNALNAISLSYSGNRAHDRALIWQGLRFYGLALWQLNQALQNQSSAKDGEDILPTCILLQQFEVTSDSISLTW
jgi:hypothetical protein